MDVPSPMNAAKARLRLKPEPFSSVHGPHTRELTGPWHRKGVPKCLAPQRLLFITTAESKAFLLSERAAAVERCAHWLGRAGEGNSLSGGESLFLI